MRARVKTNVLHQPVISARVWGGIGGSVGMAGSQSDEEKGSPRFRERTE